MTTRATDQFAYINRSYGLAMRRGTRVIYTGDRRLGPQHGAVASADGAHINIRFDGAAKAIGPFHPTWELVVESAAVTPPAASSG